MCFEIDRAAKQPRRKTAYKICATDSYGYLRSPHYPEYRGGRAWQPNTTVHSGARIRDDGYLRSFELGHEIWHAASGIYVYRTLQCALHANQLYDDQILKLVVAPEDWLFTSKNGELMTYRKVFVPANQPYIEWYE